MVRPCFLVIDREFPGMISTRKLVLETAKYNVITAYSGAEAISTFERFPHVNGVVLNEDLIDIHCSTVAKALKTLRPGIPIIAISSPGANRCEDADHHLETFDPKALLGILQTLVPKETAEIESNEELLERDTYGP